MAAVDLCTLDDVRLAMELPDSDTTRDDLISASITAASQAIIDLTQREFTPQSSSTARQFEWKGTRTVGFAPYDLRTASSVVLHPGDAAELTLVANQDYRLLPVGAPSGVYTRLDISPRLVTLSSQAQLYFGYAIIELTGDWGWPSVPESVKQAAIITVTSWLRRDVEAFGITEPSDIRGIAPMPMVSYAVPTAAYRLLSGYRRSTAF